MYANYLFCFFLFGGVDQVQGIDEGLDSSFDHIRVGRESVDQHRTALELYMDTSHETRPAETLSLATEEAVSSAAIEISGIKKDCAAKTDNAAITIKRVI